MSGPSFKLGDRVHVPVWEAWTSSDAGKRAAEHERWFEWASCHRLVVDEHLRASPAAAILVDA